MLQITWTNDEVALQRKIINRESTMTDWRHLDDEAKAEITKMAEAYWGASDFSLKRKQPTDAEVQMFYYGYAKALLSMADDVAALEGFDAVINHLALAVRQ